jgi:secondary thiamine-phosphate synthase enzyme
VRAFPVEARTRTTEDLLIFDITRDVAESVRESGVRDGICCVYSPRPSCAVRVNEFEAGLVDDLASLFTRLVSYVGLRDSRARCLSMLFGPAGETIPVVKGELGLGTWQRVLFFEFEREPSGEPRWLVQVVGLADRTADMGS